MKQLIKAAIVYKAHVPVDRSALHNHLAEKSFAEILLTQSLSVGFVPPRDDCGLVTEFPGGLAFRVRIDEKILPASAIRRELDQRVAFIFKSSGRKVGKKERAEIKEYVTLDMLARAFVKTSELMCYYQIATNLLIVPTTSRKLAGMMVSQLVQAVGSVKTETIHVSDVKGGLTTRLKNWLDHESGEFSTGEGFGVFHPCGDVALAQAERRVTIKMDALQAASSALNEAIGQGFGVTSLGLADEDGNEFRLTEQFHLKRISLTTKPEDQDDLFAAQAALEVSAVGGIVTKLCDLLGYEEPEPKKESAQQQ